MKRVYIKPSTQAVDVELTAMIAVSKETFSLTVHDKTDNVNASDALTKDRDVWTDGYW